MSSGVIIILYETSLIFQLLYNKWAVNVNVNPIIKKLILSNNFQQLLHQYVIHKNERERILGVNK